MSPFFKGLINHTECFFFFEKVKMHKVSCRFRCRAIGNTVSTV